MPPHLTKSLAAFARVCRRLGVRQTRFLVVVRVSRQELVLCRERLLPSTGNAPDSRLRAPARSYLPLRVCRCSTSRFGIGQRSGSNRTPLGLHRIAEKIGGGWPVGTVFRSRQPIGFTWKGIPLAPITTRVLWLEGLEPGFNRGGEVDSHARYIYVHGTGDEPTLGRPASCGCIHLAAQDLVRFYDVLPSATLVWIEP